MAGYIKKSLQPGETVEYRGSVSRIALVFFPVVLLVSGIVVLLVLGHNQDPSGGIKALRVIFGLEVALGVIKLIRAFFYLRAAEYAVTDRRVICKYGWIRYTTADVLITQISSVNINRTIPGRILNYGTVQILATGSKTYPLHYLKAPLKFQTAVYARLEASRLLKGTAAYTVDVRMVPGEPAPAAVVPQAPYFPPPPTPPVTPAQWAADPYGKSALRYWDGQAWTHHVSGQPANDGLSSGQQLANQGLWA
jgi:Bacterial PH domain/Protein of unknown function (DUF2510)